MPSTPVDMTLWPDTLGVAAAGPPSDSVDVFSSVFIPDYPECRVLAQTANRLLREMEVEPLTWHDRLLAGIGV